MRLLREAPAAKPTAALASRVASPGQATLSTFNNVSKGKVLTLVVDGEVAGLDTVLAVAGVVARLALLLHRGNGG